MGWGWEGERVRGACSALWRREAGAASSVRRVLSPASVEPKNTQLGRVASAAPRTCWAFRVLSHLWAEGQVAGFPGGEGV